MIVSRLPEDLVMFLNMPEMLYVLRMNELDSDKEKLFSLKGNYAGTGGKGLEVKLYREMRHIITNPDLKLVREKSVMVNGKQVGVKYYQSENGLYTFELSLYFQNKYQMTPYIPGGGSVSESIEGLDSRLHSYIAQVEPDARAVTNKEF